MENWEPFPFLVVLFFGLLNFLLLFPNVWLIFFWLKNYVSPPFVGSWWSSIAQIFLQKKKNPNDVDFNGLSVFFVVHSYKTKQA
jgi:hypothetical protein